VHALFFSTGDHVLTDVLGDQINGVAVVHKILQSPYLDPTQRPSYLEATKRVLVDLKVTSAQAYRRLIEEVGLPLPSFATSFGTVNGANGSSKKASSGGPHSAFTAQNSNYGGYNSDMVNSEPSLASVIASTQALQLQGPTLVNGVGPSHNGLSQGGPSLSNGLPQLHVNSYGQNIPPGQQLSTSTFSPSSDPFNPFSIRSPELASSHSIHNQYSRRGINLPSTTPPSQGQNLPLQGMFGAGGGGGPTSSQTLAQTSNGMMNMSMDQQVRSSFSMAPSQIHPQVRWFVLCSAWQCTYMEHVRVSCTRRTCIKCSNNNTTRRKMGAASTFEVCLTFMQCAFFALPFGNRVLNVYPRKASHTNPSAV
jgi:hypothetical protein